MKNPMDLSARHVLVTGASSGIGRAACVLASRLGARVSLLARNPEGLQETLSLMDGEDHAFHCCDVAEIGGLEDQVKQIVGTSGPLDGLVHCAGVSTGRPLAMSKPDFVRDVMTVNFFSFVELVRVISRKKNSNQGASLVGVSSVAAFRGGKAQEAYAASKAAIDSVLKPMAKELADRRIRVNAAAFGMVRTHSYQMYLDGGGSDEALGTQQYLGVAEPEDAASVLCFLLSDASRFITGTTLVADGGFLS